MTEIKLYNTVALLEDIKTKRFMGQQEIVLRRGQVGTVVEEYKDAEALEVEFADSQGQTYALLAVKASKLMPLFYNLVEPDLVSVG